VHDEKHDGVIKNKLMYQFKRKSLPSKKKGFLNYTYQEWEQLVTKKNFTDAVISNIEGEVMTLKDRSNWISGRLHNLNPSNAENTSVSNVYILAMQKFMKCTVGTAMGMGAIKYNVRVSSIVQKTTESLKAPSTFSIGLKEKAKIFFMFGFDSAGDNVLI
jgi:hypothetical protein